MKLTLTIPVLAIALNSHAQTTEKSENKANIIITDNKDVEASGNDDIYSTAGLQIKPEFPGGMTAFAKFIGSKFNIPTTEDGLEKIKVYITFIIEKDGSLSTIKLVKDPGYGIGEEIIRVLKLSPKWKPGEQNNLPVRTSYMLPFIVNLEDMNTLNEKQH
ncbi:energy transducer TonB [Flavobacterium hauense]